MTTNQDGTAAGQGRRVVLARTLPDPGGTPDHTVHLVALPFTDAAAEAGAGLSGLCGARLPPGRVETVAPGTGVWCTLCFTVHVTGEPAPGGAAGEAGTSARAAAALAYRALGWPVTLRGEQMSLNLDLDLDAVALVIPAALSARVAEILTDRRCPPPVLAHPALPAHRMIVAGERYSIPLAWPVGVHRVTGTVPLPPTVTAYGPVRWVRPPQPHALRLCREFDVCAALHTALRDPPPPPNPTRF